MAEGTCWVASMDLLARADQTKASSKFKVVFGLHRADARLMIRYIDQTKQTPIDLKDVDDDDLRDLVGVAIDTVKAYGLHHITLSIHRGDRKKRGLFDAHLTFGQQKHRYLEIFRDVISRDDGAKWWKIEGPKFSDERNWRLNKALSTVAPEVKYEANVLNMPNYTYKINGIKVVYDMIRQKSELKPLVTFRHQTLVYHPFKPQIGLPWHWSDEDAFHPQHMTEYISSLNLLAEHVLAVKLPATHVERNETEEQFGCHICVNTENKAFSFFGEESGLVMGYLQVSGPLFYILCPDEQRENWLEGYNNWAGIVYT